ncbi:MAG: glycosyltransferase family 4 protein [Thermoleophilia bacterium]|nr:glycosyltransferase family 4 protein [Thermoleophilia bacterium]
MKILIVSLYFPPAGGPGVQRPLKLASHLSELGFDVHVLAPDDPKWLHRDPTLRPPPRVRVHRARNIGPRARAPAEELYGRRGLDRLRRKAGITFRALLVPDGSVLWNVTAIPAALRIVRREAIDVVLTTSPPASVHLVGAAVRAWTGARWVADLRDAIVGFAHRRREIRGERPLARLVGRRADAVVAASEGVAESMRRLLPGVTVHVVENGCDFDDFHGLRYSPGERLRITHTGSFSGRRSPRPFLEALARTDGSAVVRFVGGFPQRDREWVEANGLRECVEAIPFVPRREALALQRDSEVLLLLIPEAAGRGRAVLTAKVFEYLAAERPILALVPPDGHAAELVRSTGAGLVVAPDDVGGIAAALVELERRWRAGALEASPLSPDLRARLDRRARVAELAELLRGLARLRR